MNTNIQKIFNAEGWGFDVETSKTLEMTRNLITDF